MSTLIGGRKVFGLAFCVGAAALMPLAITASFTLVLCSAAAFGLAIGLYSGAMGALTAFCLPSSENAARDMNMLVTGPVFAQMGLTAGGGYLLDVAQKKWSSPVAWAMMWGVSSVFYLLALPALIPVKERGST